MGFVGQTFNMRTQVQKLVTNCSLFPLLLLTLPWLLLKCDSAFVCDVMSGTLDLFKLRIMSKKYPELLKALLEAAAIRSYDAEDIS